MKKILFKLYLLLEIKPWKKKLVIIFKKDVK